MKNKLKAILLVAGTLLLMTGVYYIGEACGYRAHLINTSLDDAVPYIKWFIYFYVSWYPAIFVIPFLVYLKDKEAFLKLNATVIVSLLITLVIFVFYPTVMYRYNIPIDGFTNQLTHLIYDISSPVKCVPSLHVIYACAFLVPVFKSKKLPSWLTFTCYFFAIGISASTIFIKQHLIADVISGVAVVLIAMLLVDKFNLQKYLNKIIKL